MTFIKSEKINEHRNIDKIELEASKRVELLRNEIEKAARLDKWEGLDGPAKQVKTNLTYLQKYDESNMAYFLAGEKIIEMIVNIVPKDNKESLKGFCNVYTDILLELSKNRSNIFKNDKLKDLCVEAMQGSNKIKFVENLKGNGIALDASARSR